jgi:hypothetical protein
LRRGRINDKEWKDSLNKHVEESLISSIGVGSGNVCKLSKHILKTNKGEEKLFIRKKQTQFLV